jgi:hypothetical protein
MLDILSIIPGKKKRTSSGWYSFNGVCCQHRGHRPDNRARAGVLLTEQTSWIYSCFNCNFKCGMVLGKLFSSNTKQLLSWCGLDKDEIDKLSFHCYSQAEMNKDEYKKNINLNFPTITLPDSVVQLDIKNSEFKQYTDYIVSRGLNPSAYNYYIDIDAVRPGIIIPYYYESRLIGYTTRFLDSRKPKYLSHQPNGYLFNIDAQKDNWTIAILVEGQFDALSINGCAYMSSTITDDQSYLISKLKRDIIVVPDRDKSGMDICDRALELGYKISIPDWHNSVKDTNDAVKKYGQFPTLLSILQSATSSKIKIELLRKRFK